MSDSIPPCHFILTGGTIDSYYNPAKDTAVPNKESVIPGFIDSLSLHRDTIFTTVCMKDSRELTQEDLDNMLEAIEQSEALHIVVTHGTYTMADSARYVQGNLKREDQTIVFTASAIPIQGFSPSDGPFNLGYTLGQLEHLKPGVYVAMNGKVFAPEDVMKIISEARFTSFQK